MSTQKKAKPKGRLIIIGGREAKDPGKKVSDYNEQRKDFYNGILNDILREVKKDPVIEIIPVASSDQEVSGKDYIDAFKRLKQKVNVLVIKSRKEADSPEILDRLKQADIVFFTGGDQLKITEALQRTEFLKVLRERYEKDDFIIAGTSAGAMVMSENMINSGNSDEAVLKGIIEISPGIGLISNVIIDTHFLSRGRFSRIAEALVINNEDIGIGLCEDTGIIVTEGRFVKTVGSGTVILMESKNIRNTNYKEAKDKEPIYIDNLDVHVLSQGAGFDLHQRKFLIPDKKQVTVKKMEHASDLS